MIFALLPLLCFLFLYVLACSLRSRVESEGVRREAFLNACMVWGVLVVGITEGLGLPHALTAPWVATAWGVAAVLSGCGAFFARGRVVELSVTRGAREPLALTDVLLLAGVALVLLLLLVIAFASPANGWDSVSYHIPRILHWIQNEAPIHYPAHDTRQLIHPPFSEMSDLQFLILGGGDGFTSALRVFFMGATLVAVSLVAKQLGAGVRGQVAAVVAAATIPMHILQSPTSKNDGIVSFFLVCLAHYLLAMGVRVTWRDAAGAAIALGLAMLTKLTSYLFAMPFLVWFVAVLLGRHRRAAWRPLLLLVVVPLAINAGYYARNLDVFGHPLSDPHFSERLGAGRATPATMLSNAIRSATLQLRTPSVAINDTMKSAVVRAHEFIGQDANDPATTTPAGKYEIPVASTLAASGASPFSFMLLVVCCVLVFTRRGLRENRWLLGYTLSLIGSVAMMCAFLKWQPTLARLHLGLIVLGAPVIGVVLSGVFNRAWSTVVLVGLLLSTGSWLAYAGDRHLLGPGSIFRHSREELRFRADPGLRRPAHRAALWIRERGFQSIGLHPARPGFVESPVWGALVRLNPTLRIENVGVENQSKQLFEREPFRDFRPEVVMRTSMSPASREAIRGGQGPFESQVEYDGVVYTKQLELSRLALYTPLP